MGQQLHSRHSVHGKVFYAGKKKKRVVIGGDPHSGKSTFMHLLNEDLKQKGIDVELFELDSAAGDVQRFKTGVRQDKVPWTPELARETFDKFKKQSIRNDLTLGDTPGKVSEVTRIVTHKANGALILARDQMAVNRWSSFFGHNRIPVITIVDSKLTQKLNYYSPKHNRGQITNLSREGVMKGKIDSNNVVIEGVSFEIAQFFGLTFKERRR